MKKIVHEPLHIRNLQNILGRAGIMPFFSYHVFMVGDEGFEPSFFCSQSRRINQTFPISVFGGDEWIRATDLLRMKEMHYRCATSPKYWCPMTESNCHPLITKQVFYHLTNRANASL